MQSGKPVIHLYNPVEQNTTGNEETMGCLLKKAGRCKPENVWQSET